MNGVNETVEGSERIVKILYIGQPMTKDRVKIPQMAALMKVIVTFTL